MTNPNDRAFPFTYTSEDNINAGMTIREYFAAQAPEVPSWFKSTHPDPPLQPNYANVTDKKDREILRDWERDPIYDLPEHLQWYQEKVEEYHRLKNEHIYTNAKDRYFQWRVFYADELIKQLNQIP